MPKAQDRFIGFHFEQSHNCLPKEEKTWFSSLYDYVFGDDSEEDEESQKTEEVDDSKLYNEVEKEETSNNEKIEKTLRE